MLGLDALAGFKVMFATPIFGGGQPAYIASLWGLAGDCTKVGMETCLQLHPDSDPIRGRNALHSKFDRDERWTHLFWIDSDILFTTEQAFRLLLADKDVAVGCPPIKQDPLVYPFFPLEDHADEDGFCPVVPAVTGFMCIKRRVFDQLKGKYPALRLRDGTWRFFDNMVAPNNDYLTEDYAFCRRWQEAGGQVHCDVHSKLGHVGQHLYQGDLGKHLGFDG